MAVKLMTIDDFEEKLRDLLESNHDLCWQITSSAIGEVGDFEEYDFFDTDEFFSIFCQERNGRNNTRDIVNGFFSGYDLDVGHAPADPYADYLRWDGDTIDSTNDPAEYIYSEAFDEIIAYIKENLDNDWYPNEVLALIEEYKDNGGDLDV